MRANNRVRFNKREVARGAIAKRRRVDHTNDDDDDTIVVGNDDDDDDDDDGVVGAAAADVAHVPDVSAAASASRQTASTPSGDAPLTLDLSGGKTLATDAC